MDRRRGAKDGIGVVLMRRAALAPFSEPWHCIRPRRPRRGSVCLGYSGQSLFLPNWFVRRRGLAIGIAFAGVGVGSIVLLPWLQTVIQGAGWRTACWAMGVLVLVVLAPINLLLRKSPQDMGLQPDGAAAPSATAAAPPSNVVDTAWAAVDWTLGRAMRTARFWWIAFGYFCGLYAWYAVQVHQTKYLSRSGSSPPLRPGRWGSSVCSFSQIALGHSRTDRREWV
jgi:MFS family permease